MYLPAQFKSDDDSHALRLMREHPFASLISLNDAGLPYISFLPLHLEERADHLVLLGHCARANPHWQYLQTRPAATVSFMGPHSYLSPQVYPDLARVPTWNYLAVQCRVQACLIDDPDAKDRLLKKLIGDHEPAYAEQWRALGTEFARKMLGGIVGFELRVTELQTKLKINQHRPESHAAMKTVYQAGDDNQRALALWMDRLNLGDRA
jgi:transcriptional regulator